MLTSDRVLAAKIALEADLVARMTRILPGYVNELCAGHMGLHAREQWHAKLALMLTDHYARVVAAMLGLRSRRPRLSDVALSIEHGHRLMRRAGVQAEALMSLIDKGLRQVETWAAEQKGILDKLSSKARDVWDWLKGKLPGIANQETQEPAETTRYEQARQRAGNRSLRKRWSTMLDDRVRATHAAAEGQTRPAALPFSVGGELMMVPGDTTFGASIRERINCRCSAVYYADNGDGTTEDLNATPRGYSIYGGR